MKYGKKTIITHNPDGTQHQVIKYIKGGNTMPEQREVYEEQKKVRGQIEENIVFNQFSKLYHDDKTMLLPRIMIKGDRSAPEYYVILTYERITRE